MCLYNNKKTSFTVSVVTLDAYGKIKETHHVIKLNKGTSCDDTGYLEKDLFINICDIKKVCIQWDSFLFKNGEFVLEIDNLLLKRGMYYDSFDSIEERIVENDEIAEEVDYEFEVISPQSTSKSCQLVDNMANMRNICQVYK
ncbi:hypothetical protein MHBO_000244 [Bonamia ostreae]|uniref:Uncharacterized protein n=1 Tax=Bonamia ostreae TaxID=126728 RepID=A0ABV2AEW9_9EUKA